MFTVTRTGRIVQRTVFALLSVMIVSASLSLGAYAAESAQCDAARYTVTIAQLA